eukprot:IDg10926t1
MRSDVRLESVLELGLLAADWKKVSRYVENVAGYWYFKAY